MAKTDENVKTLNSIYRKIPPTIWLKICVEDPDMRFASLASWVPTPKSSNDLQSTRLNKNIENFLGTLSSPAALSMVSI